MMSSVKNPTSKTKQVMGIGKRKKPVKDAEPLFEEEDWLENVELEDSDEDDSDYEEGDSASDNEESEDGDNEEEGDGSDHGDSGKDEEHEEEQGKSGEEADEDSSGEDVQVDEQEIERTIMAKSKAAKQKKTVTKSKSEEQATDVNSSKSNKGPKGKNKIKRKNKSADTEVGTGDDGVTQGEDTGTEGKDTDTQGKDTEQTGSILSSINLADEYEFDSSDEEDIRNTIGNVPMEWYENYEHIGYDVKGMKIGKPPTRDELETFLNKVDNPDYWRTVFDKKTGEEITLSPEDVATIQQIQSSRYTGGEDPYAPWTDFFTHEKMIHPVTRRPEHKRSFIPSLLEKKKVSHYVHALKMGWIKPLAETYMKKDEGPRFYDIWGNTENSELTKRQRAHISAPKMKLPGHEESYNPPPEYVPTEEEILAWNESHPEDRKTDFLPKKYDCLRRVPAYKNFMIERFERCLDLYLCPRQRRLRVRVQPEDLLPQLPKPKDLQPFPTTQAIVYQGHKSYVRSISVDPSGQWLVSGSDDMTVRFWEISTGRCLKTVKVSGAVHSVAWCPNQAVCLAVAVVGNTLLIINPGLGDKLVVSSTEKLLEEEEKKEEEEEDKPSNPLVEWLPPDEDLQDQGVGLTIKHFKDLKQVTWHGRGDYFAVVIADGGHSSVMIHQLSKRRSQTPFKKSKGLVQCVAFHPVRPFFFVATQRYVRVYNLLKQELTKKLLTNAKWVSSISVHPGGDNVLVGSYDCRLSWFDMDLSTKPYKTLRHHRQAIRHVCYHKRYPLFASAADDGVVVICHGQVYNDLLQNPLIVPVKILRGHSITTSLGVLACEFHPSQPWIFTSGADSTIRLYT